MGTGIQYFTLEPKVLALYGNVLSPVYKSHFILSVLTQPELGIWLQVKLFQKLGNRARLQLRVAQEKQADANKKGIWVLKELQRGALGQSQGWGQGKDQAWGLGTGLGMRLEQRQGLGRDRDQLIPKLIVDIPYPSAPGSLPGMHQTQLGSFQPLLLLLITD